MMVEALNGDGINFAFFDLLWSKCSSDESASASPILRLPDTLLLLHGQPHHWYFTSKNGGPHKNKTCILRKKKANLTFENILEVFLTKASSKGPVADDEVIAYFISSKTEPSGDANASMDDSDIAVGESTSCSIEYFDKNTLREFVHHGRHNKSGILQRFITPHGGTHNSCIRAVWTPKLCLTDRRRTKQALHDKRYAVYERAITFDGPDVHSVHLPLRGSVLSGRVEAICNEIVKHITVVTGDKSSKSDLGVGRMVINFKVDGNGKIWILWSDSVRLERKKNGIKLLDETASVVQPLNMNTVVTLPSATKLTQIPSHDTNLKLGNKLSFAHCPSCYKCCTDENFQEIQYFTVICHFEKAMDMLRSTPESNPTKVWPPEDRFIKALIVGFGAVNQQSKSKETLVIPPVLRQCHPKLQVKGYQMYRHDPLFLQKNVRVCENCFLAYAKLKESSYLMVPPAALPAVALHYDMPREIEKVSNDESKLKPVASKVKVPTSVIDTFDCKDFGTAPEIPSAIIEPPQNAPTAELNRASQHTSVQQQMHLNISLRSEKHALAHMVELDMKLRRHEKPKTSSNPYAQH